VRKVKIKISKTDPWISKAEEYQEILEDAFIKDGVIINFRKKSVDAFYYAKEVLAPEDTGNLRSTMQLSESSSSDKITFTFSVSAFDFDEGVAYGRLHELVHDGVYRYHKEGTMNQCSLRAIDKKFGTNFKHYTSAF